MSDRQSFPISAFTNESFASVRLEIMDAFNRRLGVGSGFVAKFGASYYIVTARHVILGLSDPIQRSSDGVRSKFVNTNCFMISRTGKSGTLENRSILIDLFKPDQTRNWSESFDWDVAAVNITNQVTEKGSAPISIDLSEVAVQTDDEGNAVSVLADEDLPPVGADVFIVGYPGNLSYLTGDQSPLWKRASISSEPHMGLDGRPIFLVDTQGASGLSGSPVLYNGATLISPYGERRICDYSTARFRLVGIYCGREGYAPDAISLSMGRVFKKYAIQNTIMEPREIDSD